MSTAAGVLLKQTIKTLLKIGAFDDRSLRTFSKPHTALSFIRVLNKVPAEKKSFVRLSILMWTQKC